MITEQLKSTIMFSDFTEKELVHFDEMVHVSHISKGETLFQQGQAFKSFFYLSDGIIKLTRTAEDGTEKIIEFIRSGNYFAEALAFLNSPAYPVMATAAKDCELVSIDATKYLNLLKGSTDACFNLLASMSKRIHHLVSEIDSLTLHSTKSRVAGYLINCMSTHSQNCFKLELPKAMIASRLTMKPETFSRALHSLDEEDIISLEKSYITVKDEIALRSIANQETNLKKTSH